MSTAKDLLVIDVSEVTYCPDPNDPHNPPRDVRDRPPVRDIREAMHPVSDLGTVRAVATDGDLVPTVALDRGGAALIGVHDAGAFADRCIGCGGTGRVETPGDGPEKCHDCYGDGRESTARLDLARDLSQRARIRLVDEPDAKKLDAEIVAFLAGATLPEHPLFTLVRSFVGKPGDRGPVWGALMRLREHLDETGDLASIEIGDELVAALHERLGQMHDALGRDDTEERTL